MVGVDHVVDGTAIGSHDHVLPVKLGTNHLVQQVVVGARRYSVQSRVGTHGTHGIACG